MLKVMCVIGTRPEAIKMAPVIRELKNSPQEFSVITCITGQHREMLDQVMATFGLRADYDFNLMRSGSSLSSIAASVLSALDPILAKVQPDWVLVHGDTSTAMAAALAAFHRGIQVGHIEAGLRTWDIRQPFPEEANRRIISSVGDLHFAPTNLSRKNLVSDGVAEESVIVTGNTAIDALQWALTMPDQPGSNALAEVPAGRRLIIVTAHRRENHGGPLLDICWALRDIAEKYPDDVHLAYPVHPNPTVREPVAEILGDCPGITLLPPLGYLPLLLAIRRAVMVLTDSGGLQEEAPSLGKPVLVLRDSTERREAIASGMVRLVGVERARIVAAVSELLDDPQAYRQMCEGVNPYGDGRASQRICQALAAG